MSPGSKNIALMPVIMYCSWNEDSVIEVLNVKLADIQKVESVASGKN